MLSMRVKFAPAIKSFLRTTRDYGRIHRAMLTGSALTVTESRRVMTANNHIITGNLRRSVRVVSVRPGVVNIGSPAAYAYYIEILPDGGFLRPAMRTTIDSIAEYVAREVAGA